MSDLIGRLLGHYRIVEQIGAGGMGVVYRAHDERLDRNVAIKVLPEVVASDPDRLARFEREAKLLASLNHPNIATVYGLEEEESLRFLVMELVDGASLAGVLARGAIPFDEALPIALQIARALETAHEHGIIHRDLKPANVMVDLEGQVKVLDFGLAKAFDPSDSPPQSPESLAESPTLTADLTRGGVLLGTAPYMSPEQAHGKVVDKKTDVWAFGCVTYEMLAGKRAFAGTTSTETLASIIKDDPAWEALPGETPAPVSRLIRRCLTKDPRNRLHDIADARIVLQSFSTGDYVIDDHVLPTRMHSVWRSWLPWSLVAILAVAVVAAMMNGAFSHRKPSQAQEVVRTAIDLPPGTELTHVSFSEWNGPMRNELALSPDGRTLVFSAATKEGRSTARLYRRPMDRIEAQEISGTEGASTPFFSPDGRWIAFWADGKLMKVALDGGLPITLAEYRDPAGLFPPMGGCWGPDGTILIGTHLDGLQVVDSNGGELETLTLPERSTEYAHRMPQVLPGGRAVLFTVAYDYRGAGGHIEVVLLDTGERRLLVDSGLDGRYIPTGHLLFLRQGTLMAAPFDLEMLELTGHPAPVLEGVMQAANVHAGWANSGAGIFTVSGNGTLVFAPGGMGPDPNRQFTWVGHDGGTQTLSAVAKGGLSAPRVSPDGKWLAFQTSGLDMNLWVHDLDRGTNTKLTDGGRVHWLSWTPDGERIVFGYSQGGVANLFWMSRRGNGPMERLTTSEYLQQPGFWSPDGRYLSFVQWRPFEGTAIWILDMNSREVRPFLRSENQYTFPEFSPDGRWIAYVSDQSGREEVWVGSFPDHDQRLLVSNEGGTAPAWSPDGSEIYYLLRNKMMVVEVGAGSELTLGNPRNLIEVPSTSGGPLRGYDITPDGSRFIFTADVETGSGTPPVRQLQVVLNWFEELKRLVPTE